jgi:hypothetical protein
MASCDDAPEEDEDVKLSNWCWPIDVFREATR